MSFYLSISVYQSVCLTVSIHLYLSIYTYIYLSVSVYLCDFLSVYLSIFYVSIYLFCVCLIMYPCLLFILCLSNHVSMSFIYVHLSNYRCQMKFGKVMFHQCYEWISMKILDESGVVLVS